MKGFKLIDEAGEKWTTFLEFGAESASGKRVVGDAISGDAAYDRYQLVHYIKEIIEIKRISQSYYPKLNEIPRKEKMLFLHSIMANMTGEISYFELGSSLFEVIDGIEMANHMSNVSVDTSRIDWIGVEPSELFSQTAMMIHPEHKISMLETVSDLPRVNILYDRAVSSYAFRSEDELAAMLNQADVVFANLFFDRTSSFTTVNNYGKGLHYFNLGKTLEKLNQPLFYLFGRFVENRVEGFFLGCRKEDFQAYLAGFHDRRLLNEFIGTKDFMGVNAWDLLAD